MTEKYQPIPHRLKNMAVGGHVAGAVDIYDDVLFKNQEDINSSVDTSISSLETGVADRYTKEEVNNLISRTPETDVVVLDVPEGSTAADVLDTIPAADRPNKLFRLRNDDNTAFSEYGWTGTEWALLANKDYGIDDTPVEESDNLVKSGGVYEEFKKRDDLTDTSLHTKYSTVTIDIDEKIIDEQIAEIFYGLTKVDHTITGSSYILGEYDYSMMLTCAKYAMVVVDQKDKIMSATYNVFLYGMEDDNDSKNSDYLTLYNDVDMIFDNVELADYDVNILGHAFMVCDINSVPLTII